MNDRPSHGYDAVTGYSADDLENLYLKQGLPRKQARSLAKTCARTIDSLNKSEQRLWFRVRRNEDSRDPVCIDQRLKRADRDGDQDSQ